jgi:hypothetical protein
MELYAFFHDLNFEAVTVANQRRGMVRNEDERPFSALKLRNWTGLKKKHVEQKEHGSFSIYNPENIL